MPLFSQQLHGYSSSQQENLRNISTRTVVVTPVITTFLPGALKGVTLQNKFSHMRQLAKLLFSLVLGVIFLTTMTSMPILFVLGMQQSWGYFGLILIAAALSYSIHYLIHWMWPSILEQQEINGRKKNSRG